LNEFDELKNIYQQRDEFLKDRYNPLNPDIMMTVQEKERLIVKWINTEKISPVSSKKLIEIGCGNGSNLLFFLKLGFKPENIVANELIEQRAESARKLLPETIKIIIGNAIDLQLPAEEFNIVFQSTVFSSILSFDSRKKLADIIWKIVKPGGGILWYDFIYNNPQNPNVRKVTLKEVKQLFPIGEIKYCRLTLAPPISRVVTKIHPNFYHLFNLFPFLRTHILCWIKKI